MSKSDLMPCPFCAADVESVGMQIVCLRCSANTSFMICSVTSHAHRLWNSRREPDPAAAAPTDDSRS